MTNQDMDSGQGPGTPKQPSIWWGYPGMAFVLWVIYRITEPWLRPRWAMTKVQAFALAYVILMFAWHYFLYDIFLVYCSLVQAGEEDEKARKKIAAIPLAEAKARALELLTDPMRFQCAATKAPPGPDLPPALGELFGIYELVEARDRPKEVRLDRQAMRASRKADGFIVIGRYFDEEVVIRAGKDMIYEIDRSQTSEERERGGLPSVYHWIVRTAQAQGQSREDAAFNGDTSAGDEKAGA